ncbi:tRNA synthetase RNA-binding protein [Marinitoga sp. 1135]|uniref:Ribosome-associated heat shock protein implicated in recycling of 50S subunit n=1 Tax=Marinitoga piezophila (strain DSM 14283 / JCM 11233 / KA3) TaxID=443254 RepID=H2J464_MARPK|nr:MULTISPECIES: S4 domain-containing protein [Marinitoga]AEX85879.1 ribosome-associated heat shock protein implicated in recycling of 50S subunit [Marinitoga piezophila KA3]APT76315.1 tRNA synthetase RNA-binding protein [Marinitoga sp. 1137]NUU96081.1 tRNA synthetase RNA-binding protein [Marinitoga sp. 1135]NUU97992.1 tRNA synthetase RNA-binding protein [Marinitoga sp. 1138]
MRLDKFLKVNRIIKRRTVANELAKAGKILKNEKTLKPSYEVKPGDIISIILYNKKIIFKVTDNYKIEIINEIFNDNKD